MIFACLIIIALTPSPHRLLAHCSKTCHNQHMKAKISQQELEALLALVHTSLEDDKGEEIVTMPLAGKSSIADYMVIASGRSTRQVASMAVKLAKKLKEHTGFTPRVEGLATADWVLIDAFDIIIHIFRPEVRVFYGLERMWGVELPEPQAHGA
jgi:ribosome-associated protein